MAYAELLSCSNFTFQRGASHSKELVERAMEVGYSARALTDECTLAGIVRAHDAAIDSGLKLISFSNLGDSSCTTSAGARPSAELARHMRASLERR